MRLVNKMAIDPEFSARNNVNEEGELNCISSTRANRISINVNYEKEAPRQL